MDRWWAAAGEGMDDERVKELLEQFSDDSLLKLSTHTHAIAMPTSRSASGTLSLSSSDALVLDTDLLARFNRLKAPPPTPRAILLPSSSSSSSCTADAAAAAAAAPPPPPVLPLDPAEVDILGSHLAARLAVLKSPTSVLSTGEKPSLESGVASLTENSSSLNGNPSSGFSNPSALEAAHTIEHEKQTRCCSEAVSGGLTDTMHDSEVRKLLSLVSDQIKLARIDDSCRTGSSKAADGPESDNSEEEISDRDVDQMVEWAKDAARLDNNESDDDDNDEFDGDGCDGQGAVENSDADQGEAGLDRSAKPVPSMYKKSKRTGHRLKFW